MPRRASPERSLLKQVEEPIRSALAQMEDLMGVLLQHHDQARAAWPGFEIPQTEYFVYLLQRLSDQDADRALRNLQASDLYLCCGCVRRDRVALVAFHKHYIPDIARTLTELRLGPALVEDLQQALIEQLLIGVDGAAPMVTNYAGLGRLRSWLRVVTARTGRRVLAREKRLMLIDDDRIADRLADDQPAQSSISPEAKQAYRAVFKRSLKQSMKELSARERTLLRYRFGDSLPLQQIAAVYRVHHTTVHRWLQRAQDTLLRRTYEQMTEELDLGDGDCASIVRMIQTNFDLTLGTLFARKVTTKRNAAVKS